MDVDSNMLPDSSGDLRCSSQLGISTVRPASSRLLPTRVSKACARCRRKKSRCDAYRPCSLCVRANATCIHIADPIRSHKSRNIQNNRNAPRSVVDKSNVDEEPLVLGQNLRNNSLYSSPTTQFAPDSDCTVPRSSGSLDDSPTSVYQDAQSSMDITRKIIRMHGRNVVKRATSAIPDGQDQIIAAILGIASWYRAETSVSNSKFSNEDWGGWRVKLFAVAETRFLELMDERSLASLQTCLLLGTYHVYHGRPNASLALLGATIKIAQAMGLHRESVRSGSDENEERKRVWWTIYTWDRFASITYGRPLGINDSDCNVSLPADINEWARPQTANQQGVLICFSTYQSQLRKERFTARYTALMEDVSRRLTNWCDQLPTSLQFNFDCDIPLEASLEQKVYRRQALALQLTYDNILIILHRPIMARQVDSLCRSSPVPTHNVNKTWPTTATTMPENLTENPNFSSLIDSSQQWWAAAVRISCITKLPNTAQLATDSHLVGFLAIILFNSAIVMVVYALSDPLSNRAQEAKRNLTRILRLENLLAMLGPACGGRSLDEETAHGSSSLASYQSTVEDAPHVSRSTNLQANSGSSTNVSTNPSMDEMLRLNESLSFVQKAFFPSNDFDDNSATPIIPPTHQHGSFANNSYSDDWPPANAEGFENPESYPEEFGAIDNGIYWIWEAS
ncbi:hypothetical protein V500_02903 [Pseudogymnoascus sp. VKM F-4518 (FW-2643)]|nr:hypothetical protein V500_02903 [Pseudogymnoascus sp. VKM F-4518 (FW-2643)]